MLLSALLELLVDRGLGIFSLIPRDEQSAADFQIRALESVGALDGGDGGFVSAGKSPEGVATFNSVADGGLAPRLGLDGGAWFGARRNGRSGAWCGGGSASDWGARAWAGGSGRRAGDGGGIRGDDGRCCGGLRLGTCHGGAGAFTPPATLAFVVGPALNVVTPAIEGAHAGVVSTV